ncbi:MAG: hypothetical protein R3C11_13375 [Planctomycetaceae bacterium]
MSDKPPRTIKQKLFRAACWTTVLVLILFIGWRQWRVWRIPDIEPFDKAAFIEELRAENHDITIFEEAYAMLEAVKQSDPATFDKLTDYDQRNNPRWWSHLSSAEQQLVEECRPAIEKWLSGKNSGSLLMVDPDNPTQQKSLDVPLSFIPFSILLRIENTILIEEGKSNEALQNCRQALFLLQHTTQFLPVTQECYHQFSTQLSDILSFKEVSSKEIYNFSNLLHFLEADLLNVQTHLKSIGVLSDSEFKRSLQESSLANPITNEPEAGRRVLNLLIANQLKYCEEPLLERPEIVIHELSLESIWEKKLKDFGLLRPANGLNRLKHINIIFFHEEGQDENLINYLNSLLYSRELIGHFQWSFRNTISHRDSLQRDLQSDIYLLMLHGFYREEGRFPNSFEELTADWPTPNDLCWTNRDAPSN